MMFILVYILWYLEHYINTITYSIVCCKLATRFLCVNITPLGSPIVPLEYGKAATSLAGSMAKLSGKLFPSSSRRVANGLQRSRSPSIVIISCTTIY